MPKHHTSFPIPPLLPAGQTCMPIVSWWRGEQNGNDEVGGNHVTLNNGASYVDGYVGSAFSFDGIDDDARVVILEGENLDFRGKSQLSVEAWIKTTDNQGSFVEQWKGVSTFGLRVLDGKVRFFYLKGRLGLRPFSADNGRLACRTR